jgi:membrane protein YqaA with SNARE-associated domain
MFLDIYRLAHHFFHLLASLAPTSSFTHRLWQFFRHLGGPGLILLGVLDNSLLPLTGSMDALTIVLAAHQRNLWPYYALMATAGAVLGGFLTYRLGRKGGKEGLERRLSHRRFLWVNKTFEKWGFGSISISVILPPPFPVVPFLLAAGAIKYPVKKFLGALTLGRAVRYFILAYLGTIYGRQIITLVRQHGYQILATYIAIITIVILLMLLRRSRAKSAKRQGPAPSPARAS